MANIILTPSDGKPITTVAELNSVIAQADAETKAGTYEIDLAGNIALTSALEAINLRSGDTLTINGAGDTLSGGGLYRGQL